ncbi:MAG: heme exporter protein CcmB [Myxococcaceae bacterium]
MNDVAPRAEAVSPIPVVAERPRLNRPGLLRTAWLLLLKDLLLEWRTRARMSALIFFAFATLLLFSFAMGPDTKLLQKGAGGFLWLGILFASVLSLGESFRIEAENSSLDGLRLIPADARALFLAKAGGNAVLLILLSTVLLFPMFALYDVGAPIPANATDSEHAQLIFEFIFGLVKIIGLGCLAISAPGTIYAAIASNARARDVLLPVLLFPLLVPALLAAVKGTNLVLAGDPMNQLPSWLGLLLVFNLIYWGLGFVLFPRVIED